MQRTLAISTVLLLSLGSGACADPESSTGVLSWEEFRAGVIRHPTRAETWIVEGDIPIQGEQALHDYYERTYLNPELTERSWIDRWNDFLRVYDPERKLSLTYCVSDNFGADKAAVVAAMATAAKDWERATDVNFIYMPALDATCTQGDDAQNLWFAVANIPDEGGLCASAFFPDSSAANRVLEITDYGLTTGACRFATGGLLRHELGHALGLFHEFARPDAGCEYQPYVDPEYLSEMDARSVMGYTNKACTSVSLPTLSRRDVAGIGFVYHGTRDGWISDVGGTDFPQWANFQSLGTTKDIYWYEPPTTGGADAISYGQANGTIQQLLLAVSAPGKSYRPILGKFNNDFRADIYFYSESPNETDKLFLKTAADDYSFTQHDVGIGGIYQPLVGQFTASSYTDIFWYGPGGDPDVLWKAKGVGSAPFFDTFAVDIGDSDDYYVPMVGNFDGDTDSDIFFYNPDSDVASSSKWLKSNGNGTFNVLSVNHAGKGILGNDSSNFFYSQVLGDFNGNGFHDIFWYAPGQATNARFWAGGVSGPGTGYNFTGVAPAGDYKVYAGDFNGDKKTDLLWHHQTGSSDKVWQMSGTSFAFTQYSVNIGTDEANIVIGDLNADGKDDIYSWDPLGTDRVYKSNGNGSFTNTWSATGPAGYPIGHGRG